LQGRHESRREIGTANHAYCGYQYHAAFNPDHDYDFINYSDTLDFEIDIDGEVGAADVVAFGSFTSAGCTSGKACGLVER